MPATIQNRHFFHAAGFDPTDLARRHRSFVREAARFAKTWGVTAAVSDLQDPAAAGAHWTVTTSAPGWQVRTSFEYFEWSDIVRADLSRPRALALWQAALAFVDFVGSGTAIRYFRANWKYGMFFLVPFLDVALFAAVAIAAGALAGARVHPPIIGAVSGALIAALAFGLLMRWPGERWGVPHALADWVFAREYMRGRRPDIAARIEAFAERLVHCSRCSGIDEMVIAGHSLGATLLIDALTRALDRDSDLGRRGPQLCLLTIGATIPKLALHPAGEWLRAKTRRIATETSLDWAEYQARDDVISFYRFDPVKLVRTTNGTERPLVRRVQIHDMLGKAAAHRMLFRFMRLHYQFVMANERRAAYDYFMLMCGPAPFRETIRAPNGPADLYAADGRREHPAGIPR